MITLNCEKTFTASCPLNASNFLKHLTGFGYTSLGHFSGWPNMMDNLSIITLIKTNNCFQDSFKIKKQVFPSKWYLGTFNSFYSIVLEWFNLLPLDGWITR